MTAILIFGIIFLIALIAFLIYGLTDSMTGPMDIFGGILILSVAVVGIIVFSLMLGGKLC